MVIVGCLTYGVVRGLKTKTGVLQVILVAPWIKLGSGRKNFFR